MFAGCCCSSHAATTVAYHCFYDYLGGGGGGGGFIAPPLPCINNYLCISTRKGAGRWKHKNDNKKWQATVAAAHWDNLRTGRESKFKHFISRMRTGDRYNLRTGTVSERDTCQLCVFQCLFDVSPNLIPTTHFVKVLNSSPSTATYTHVHVCVSELGQHLFR